MWVNCSQTIKFGGNYLSGVITEQILRELEGRPEIVVSGIVWR